MRVWGRVSLDLLPINTTSVIKQKDSVTIGTHMKSKIKSKVDLHK